MLTIQTIGVIIMGRNRANKNTDLLGFGEIGGLGQLVYHSFRFAAYEIDNLEDGTWAAIPVCDAHILLTQENGQNYPVATFSPAFAI